MKFPNHISLDNSTVTTSPSNTYWIFKFIETYDSKVPVLDFFSFQKKFLFKKETFKTNEIIKNSKKFTTWYSLDAKFSLTKRDLNIEFIDLIVTKRPKVKRKPILTNYIITKLKTVGFYKKKKIFNIFFFIKFLKNLKKKKNFKFFTDTTLWTLFDINFLKKEKIYTKLKYSRVPQYDIVSGGSAMLFAGFLGFLICEKFGFELLDSGDFYYLFMYLVFFFFFCSLYLKTIGKVANSWNLLSLKWFFLFYKVLFFYFINFCSLFFNKK